MSLARRLAVTTAATAGSLVLLTGTALAHHCYVPTKSLNGPTSANWFFITVPQGAEMFGLVTEPCQKQVDAGVAALRSAGLPLSVKFFDKQTIGNTVPEHLLRDGKGLEQMGAGSTVADQALTTYAAAANAASCSA